MYGCAFDVKQINTDSGARKVRCPSTIYIDPKKGFSELANLMQYAVGDFRRRGSLTDSKKGNGLPQQAWTGSRVSR